MKIGQRTSLEDAVRMVQKKYQNKPSPLALMNEQINGNPSSVQQYQKVNNDPRSNLLGNFRPPNDTFR